MSPDPSHEGNRKIIDPSASPEERAQRPGRVITSRPWTTEEEQRLCVLAVSGDRPATIGKQIGRSEQAIRKRLYKLGIPPKRITIAKAERTFANHHERQFMEYLRGTGWVKGKSLPPTDRLMCLLLNKGWIERRQEDNEIFYRMTDVGLIALKAPVPVQKSWATPQGVRVGKLGLRGA